MDFTVNKKNLKAANFIDFETQYDSVVIPYENGSDRYPVVYLLYNSDEEGNVPVTDPIKSRSIGTYVFEYSEENGKWKFEGNYYTKQQLIDKYGVFYLFTSGDAEKKGDTIYVYVVRWKNALTNSFSAAYKRTGKTYYAKKRLGRAYSISMDNKPGNIDIGLIGAGMIASKVIGKEPYSYRFEGLVYPPYLTVSDTLKYGGKVYGNGNTTIKFGTMPTASIEYPEAGENQNVETNEMSSTDASVARDAIDYETLYSMVRNLESTFVRRFEPNVGASNRLAWSITEAIWDIYVGRYVSVKDSQGNVIKTNLVREANLVRLTDSAGTSYFGGNVWAGMIKAGIYDGVNRGYISGSMIDSSIGTANCDNSIKTPLGYASSHQNTLSGSVKNYNPWFNSVYIGDDKVQFAPKEITYKDADGNTQTITVLAKVE